MRPGIVELGTTVSKTLLHKVDCRGVGSEKAYCQIEKMANLEQLAATRFTVSCFPFKVKRFSAGFAHVVALLDDEKGPRT